MRQKHERVFRNGEGFRRLFHAYLRKRTKEDKKTFDIHWLEHRRGTDDGLASVDPQTVKTP
jgi:hypothetical protein